jgi:hypothetical protein
MDQLSKDVLHVLEAGGVPTVRQALPRFSAELERARRYMRPFTIVVLGPVHEDALVTEIDGSSHSTEEASTQEEVLQPVGLFSLLSAFLAAAVREALRDTDIVSYAVTSTRCVIGMPEVDADDARQAIDRLQRLCVDRHLPPVSAGLALFPRNGWTLEELLRHAESPDGAALRLPAANHHRSLDR